MSDKSPTPRQRRQDQLVLAVRAATKKYGFLFSLNGNDEHTHPCFINERAMRRIENAIAAMVEAGDVR